MKDNVASETKQGRAHRLFTSWRRSAARAVREPVTAISVVVFATCVTLAVGADVFAVQDTRDLAQANLFDALLPPGSVSADTGMVYLLGTDALGRDLWSACLYGLRISLVVGVISTLIAVAFGTAFGLISAVAGGRVDAVMMRIVDTMLSFPAILIALLLLGLLGRGVEKTILALVLAQWALSARTLRAAALVELGKPYVDAARVLGLSWGRIVFLHVLPNSMAPVIVVATVQLSAAIALEASLSFLGVGLPVTEQSLGIIINEGRSYLFSGRTWLSLYPGLFLLALILSANLLGDALRHRFDPRRAL